MGFLEGLRVFSGEVNVVKAIGGLGIDVGLGVLEGKMKSCSSFGIYYWVRLFL